jgi:hypothetical protein
LNGNNSWTTHGANTTGATTTTGVGLLPSRSAPFRSRRRRCLDRPPRHAPPTACQCLPADLPTSTTTFQTAGRHPGRLASVVSRRLALLSQNRTSVFLTTRVERVSFSGAILPEARRCDVLPRRPWGR